MICDKKKKWGKSWILPTVLFVGVTLVYAAFWLIIDISIVEPETRGVFGDKFGAVNALFSGLAFAGLILTLFLQKEELSLQRDELEQTREELTRQRKEFEIQNKNLKLQRFENSFFSLLSHYLELVNRLEYECEDGADPYKGQGYNVFDWFYRSKTNFDRDAHGFYGRTRNETELDLIKKAYFSYPGLSCIKQCMVFLCETLTYIDRADLLDGEKQVYRDILFSHLSKFEIAFLFYHTLSNSIDLQELERKNHYFKRITSIPESHYTLIYASRETID